ncbi:MAG: adenylate kinase [Candidatus Eremiobacteraeota bacterium]|nr:adenylate kinase [Candidatus Eremiobacteraeota bacterium]
MGDVVLLGGPGAGKGTQAQILQSRFGYRQIATGDLLRDHRNRGSDLGKAAQGFMQRGELVPDELIVRMVEGELRDDAGVLFDGFPRTAAQAEALDGALQARGRGMPRAIYFAIPRSLLEERLLGRWTNPRNGRVYHERFNPPAIPGIDDEDGGVLVEREDDKPGTIQKRLDVFEAQTMPLIEYYNRSHRLVSIDATQPVAAVTSELERALALEASR